ncbi:hypothetical protein [Gimesia aquarii]|uniref:Uncharacterized protein n=1 Tax=Gimesia aquarii TaxID=2527964 RepID=A0A517W3U9_9PLAN|nr:hypothetical protein [Gimesia aquarii]QDT99910.1 hypothetical protein V144x_54240 [Gimesia aquarii]
MSPWVFPILIFATWIVWCGACISGKAVHDARHGIPDDQRSGTSILPGIPIIPLIFWGLALTIDSATYPWGTYSIGGFHCVLLVLLVITMIRNVWNLHRLADGT